MTGRPSGDKRYPRRWTWIAACLLGVVAIVARPLARHLRATALVARVAGIALDGAPLGPMLDDIDEQTGWLETPVGKVRVRIYRPRGSNHPPGIVVLHGMHRLGIDEPRLKTLARALAAVGVLAYTPELPSLMDYSVAPSTIEVIGAAAQQLSKELHRSAVGVLGLSFAGSLSLLAAIDPRYQGTIAFVVSVGGYQDLSRVTQFFVRDEIVRNDGSVLRLQAHPYGTLVLAYSHPEALFGASDLVVAHAAIRALLWEDRAGALALAEQLTPEGRARAQVLFSDQRHALSEPLLTLLRRQGPAMSRVSPRGHLGAIHVRVYLLAGAGDTVIPSTETQWLAQETPARWLGSAVVSEALGHVELHGSPPLGEAWRLVHFMAQVIAQADMEPRDE